MRMLLVATGLLALTAAQPQRGVIRSAVTYVSTDLVVRNDRGEFVANLGRRDFDVYEDGVKQDVVTFVLTHGGRLLSEVPPQGAAQEGVLLPPIRPPNDASGRVFLIFLDDLHMSARDTPRVRDLIRRNPPEGATRARSPRRTRSRKRATSSPRPISRRNCQS